MRLYLKASAPIVDEAIIQLKSGVFTPATWQNLGYTTYTVLCIGAAGGRGGHVGSFMPGGNAQPFVGLGGGGGGGGAHMVTGLLSALPASVDVVVGAKGSNGAGRSTPGLAGHGADGGATTFGGTICRASGGKGGLGMNTADQQVWYGGQGGIGGQTTAGGGGTAGKSGAGAGTGGNGFWNGVIGSGGGGGGGGYAQMLPNGVVEGWWFFPLVAGEGSLNSPRTSQAVAGGKILDSDTNPALLTGLANHGGGANASILTGSNYIAGTYHHSFWAVPGTANGACFIKLTA